jgi:hypothetical protein
MRTLPRLHLTRYQGIFAPANQLPAAVTPAGGGRGAPSHPERVEPQAPKHVALTWMQRLKRVFAIEIEEAAHAVNEPGVVGDTGPAQTMNQEDGLLFLGFDGDEAHERYF